MSKPHVSLTAISKAYNGAPILKGISLDIVAGEFIALVGPSGCGKSTLLRAIAGLEAVDGGRIVLDGKDVTAIPASERDVAMVFQSYALYPHLTARQNMAVPLFMRRTSRWQRLPFIGALMPGRKAIDKTIQADIEHTAQALKIDHLLERKPSAMSGGQRQRVALGRAIVREPLCFLMDEPLSNLDAALRVHTRNEIVELHKRLGVTTIYVTHDQEEALSMADRIAVMQNGEILQVASPQVIYEHPASLAVAEFIGSPKINLLPASIDAEGQVFSGRGTLASGYHANAGEDITIGIRPEHINISPLTNIAGALPFVLERVEFLGREAIAHGTVGAKKHPFMVHLSAEQAPRLTPRTYTLIVSPDRVMVFGKSGERLMQSVAQETLEHV